MEIDDFTVLFLYDQYAHDIYIIYIYTSFAFLQQKTGRLAARICTAAIDGLFRQTIPYIVTARLPFV